MVEVYPGTPVRELQSQCELGLPEFTLATVQIKTIGKKEKAKAMAAL